MRDFERLMRGVMSRRDAIFSVLTPIDREVRVNLEHRHTARDGVRAVNLDLVIVLRNGL